MTERFRAHLRWVFAAILISFPLAAAFERGSIPSVSHGIVAATVTLPWSLGALGLALGLRPARGFAIGIGVASALASLLVERWSAPRDLIGASLCAQALLLLLALPFFGSAFLDAPRVRFLAGSLGFAAPVIALHATIAMPESIAWTMVTLGVLVTGAVGLAQQKTWALLGLLAGALLLALAPLVTPSAAPFAWVSAGAVVLGVLAWIGPVLRALRPS